MSENRLAIVGIIGLLALISTNVLFSQSATGTATLVVLSGEGQVIHNNASFIQVKQTHLDTNNVVTVNEGDTIMLGKGGNAQLNFHDGSTVELTEGSTLEVSEILNDEGSFQIRLKLLAGRTLSRVNRLLNTNESFEIYTPSSTASVRGTVFVVEVLTLEASYVAVQEGVVLVKMADGQEVNVTAGFEVTAVLNQPLNLQPLTSKMPASPNETSLPATILPTTTAMPLLPSTPTIPSTETAVPQQAPQLQTIDSAEPTPIPLPTEAVPELPTYSAAETIPPTLLPTVTSAAATATFEYIPPSATPLPPTVTSIPPTLTPEPPTATPIPPTETPPPLPPTATPIPPTATPPPLPPTATPIPPTDTPQQVILCHNPDSNNPQTIEVDQDAVQAHLDHGDHLGACP